jgi:hypothetical protein
MWLTAESQASPVQIESKRYFTGRDALDAHRLWRGRKETQSPNNRDRNGLVIEREAGFWRTYELCTRARSRRRSVPAPHEGQL